MSGKTTILLVVVPAFDFRDDLAAEAQISLRDRGDFASWREISFSVVLRSVDLQPLVCRLLCPLEIP